MRDSSQKVPCENAPIGRLVYDKMSYLLRGSWRSIAYCTGLPSKKGSHQKKAAIKKKPRRQRKMARQIAFVGPLTRYGLGEIS